jgi:2-polyprenyl-3-methyl-5-hydroxy-6-metoxy-1,4-benzoquinol methylase
MSPSNATAYPDVEVRARQSLGVSNAAIYRMVAAALSRLRASGVLFDVGCGSGRLYEAVGSRFSRYVGVDVIRYDGFPAAAEFVALDLERGAVPLPDGGADVVTAVETIEHLENPRAFLRELVRLTRPGGWVVVTTPNQLSLLSKLTLVFKNQFNAFQDGSYPAHLTALLEIDLRRIAAECGLAEVNVTYSGEGRIPGAPWHYPRFLSRWFFRALSDNVLLCGRRPLG